MANKLTAEDILEALNTHYCESIFITDGEGKIIFVNQLGAERMGTERDKLMGRNVNDLVSEGMYEKSTTLAAIETKQDAVGTLNPDDEKSSVSHSVPVLDAGGNVIMVVTNNMNKEHSREWEEILKRERQVSERLRRELDNLRDQEEEPLIAQSEGIHLPDEVLCRQALQWAMWQNTRSGRTARQFINHLLGKGGKI